MRYVNGNLIDIDDIKVAEMTEEDENEDTEYKAYMNSIKLNDG